MNRIRYKSTIIKSLAKITLIASLLLLLGGCSVFERQEYEKRISRVSEVYPTEKVSDLFEKFPGGFIIQHEKIEKLPDKNGLNEPNIISHTLTLTGEPNTQKIQGTYQKENLSYSEIEVESSVSYSDTKGLETTDGYQLEPIIKENTFLFQHLNLRGKNWDELEYSGLSSNPTLNTFRIWYIIRNKELNKYLNLDEQKHLEINFSGNKSPSNGKDSNIYIQIGDLSNEGFTTYLNEQVIGFE